jgi:protein-disulfide isomerase
MSVNLRVVVTLLAAIGAGACGSDQTDGAADTEDLSRSLLEQPITDGRSTPVAVDPELAEEGPRISVSQVGINRGEVEAPVKVVELSDYGCGYCRQFHEETFPVIRSDFIDTGMVEWKFVPFVTGMFDGSLEVTETAECVYAQDEAAFEAINRRLWNEQGAWKGEGDPASVVREWVADLEIDQEAFDTCMSEDERLSRVASATTLAQQLGVRGTPTFIIIGYPPLQGVLPTEMFQEVLTAVHAEAVRKRDSVQSGATEGSNGPNTPPTPGDSTSGGAR